MAEKRTLVLLDLWVKIVEPSQTANISIEKLRVIFTSKTAATNKRHIYYIIYYWSLADGGLDGDDVDMVIVYDVYIYMVLFV